MTRTRRRTILASVGISAGLGLLVWWQRMPPDTTPAGAYQRIASNISRGRPEDCFAYLEEDAQHACFTILSYAKLAVERIERDYPADARQPALAPYTPIVQAGTAPAVWVYEAERHGWIQRLRRDLSGIEEVEIEGDRASVVTVRGTRYPFRRRPNGIWGLTIFTAALVAEAAKLARDWELIQGAAADYRAAQK